MKVSAGVIESHWYTTGERDSATIYACLAHRDIAKAYCDRHDYNEPVDRTGVYVPYSAEYHDKIDLYIELQ